MKSTLFVISITAALSLTTLNPKIASASCFTPLEWQREVKEHPVSALRGQRKHLTWIRDRDRDFIDDEIARRFRPDQLVNVIVDLNTCLTGPQIRELLSPFGRIKSIGRQITYVLLDAVRVTELPRLRALQPVAMIEWQAPLKTMDDVSSRAVQSLSSQIYSPRTAEDRGKTGQGMNIAILDTGVDALHEAFDGKFVWAYDATTGKELGNTPTNNDKDPLGNILGHGTAVAGVALGNPRTLVGLNIDNPCRTPKDNSPLIIAPHPPFTPPGPSLTFIQTDVCAGVAIEAGLVDVKVCVSEGKEDDCPYLFDGLDWLSANAKTHKVRVANISIAYCAEDDGESTLAQLVNRLVALGVAVAAAHGNFSRCYPDDPGHSPILTGAPGSASGAMTVQGTYDQETVARGDDTLFFDALLGPRTDFDPNTGPVEALKPDFSAPAYNIWSAKAGTRNEYTYKVGTSVATPHVAGAAAVLLQARPYNSPAGLKHLFKETADSTRNLSNKSSVQPYTALDPVWVPDFGSGILNVYCALLLETGIPVTFRERGSSDSCNAILVGPIFREKMEVGFPHCIGPPMTSGGLCQVTSPHPQWHNSFDITTATAPQVGVPNTITAQVRNSGPVAAAVLVNFGVYEFAVGNNQFFDIGTQKVSIPAGTTVSVSQPWTPESADHTSIRVSIEYGLDFNVENNVTQLTLHIAPSANVERPSSHAVRIENPFMVPARMEIRPQSNREGWICRVSEDSFVLDPFDDCPRKVQVTFDVPPDAPRGDSADCDIAVYATPTGAKEPVLIGGATTRTLVPKSSP